MIHTPSRSQASCADASEFGSLHLDNARQRILAAVRPIFGYEKIATADARGRVLHEAIRSPLNVPPHNNAAVDGYAIRGADLPTAGMMASLQLAGSALAGHPFAGVVQAGQAVRIMTGAPMPAGADTVLMQEQVDTIGTEIQIDASHKPGQNVRRVGEDIKQNQTVFMPGRLCRPPDIGVIASLGINEVKVKRKLRIAIFSSGDEIHGLGTPLPVGGIYDSNRYSLAAALQQPAIEILDLGIIPDDPTALNAALQLAARQSDVVISSGGVSVGAADYTKQVLQELGSVQFWKVAMKPGRPIAFGNVNDATFFGLPGNPVAVMVTFYFLVLPAIQKRLGIDPLPALPLFSARSAQRLRKKPGRTEIQRGILKPVSAGHWQVSTTGKQGSGILTSMSLANAFIILAHERGTVEIGDEVLVLPFDALM